MIESWDEFVRNEMGKPYYNELHSFLKDEYAGYCPIYPPADDILNALRTTALSDVKVVIVGQDPYHGPGQANGFSFSVRPGVSIPRSLMNIYKELQSDLGCYIPNNGCLLKWAQQGVLLLNRVLTVREHSPASHKGKGWEEFTQAAIETLVERHDQPLVFLLWGNHAAEVAAFVDMDNPNHLVLVAPHPSPLSARKGFFGCEHFRMTNDFLVDHGLAPIDWQIENN